MDKLFEAFKNGIFTSIASDVYMVAVLFLVFICASNVFYYRNHLNYNHVNDKKMKNHLLNKKYNFDKKKRLDFDEINKLYSVTNSAVAVFSTILIIAGAALGFNEDASIAVGLISYFGLSVIQQALVSKKLAEKYAKVK